MQNFDYQTPTRLIFGEGVVEKLQKLDLLRKEKITFYVSMSVLIKNIILSIEFL